MESDSEEFIYQVEESEDSNSNKEIMSGNIEESSTSSPLEVILVTTVFTDVFPEDSTLFLPEVTPVTIKFDDSCLKTSRVSYHRRVISNTPLI